MTREEKEVLYRTVFGTPEGRAVLRDLERECRLDQAVFVPDNARTEAYLLGRQSVGLHIRGMVTIKGASNGS